MKPNEWKPTGFKLVVLSLLQAGLVLIAYAIVWANIEHGNTPLGVGAFGGALLAEAAFLSITKFWMETTTTQEVY